MTDQSTKWKLLYRSEKELCYGSGPEGAHNKILLSGPDREANAELFMIAGEARDMVIEANNSLYGSQGYFTSDLGKYHLSNKIEDIKQYAKKLWHRAQHMDELVEAAEVLVADSRWVSGDPNFERFRDIIAKIKGDAK